METAEYAPGRSVDLYGDPSDACVLLWHGMQTDSRGALTPLAETLAGHRIAVVVPDWNSHASDGGRADLLGSVGFAREHATNPDDLVLVGWSMGGVAAAGLTVHSTSLGLHLRHTVCLAGAFMARNPITGGYVADDLVPGAGSPFTLLHGVHDDVVPLTSTTTFAASLAQAGWPVEVVEMDADHGSIAGARYDSAVDRYTPADDQQTLRVAGDVAERIAAATGR
jgi:dipeptidyl aminopeptidase/acylaminoacyl peptidase